MTRPIRLVAPFRPFPSDGIPHAVALEGFDWIEALRMMSASALRVCPSSSFAVLTDVDTTLPLPTLSYATSRRALMLWYLEIAACYLESDEFDRDTIALDADQLIYGDLAPWFDAQMDLGIVVRRTPKDLSGLPILNGVQFWPVKSKGLLAGFYRHALAIAETLPVPDQVWGADTIALARLLEPLRYDGQIAGRSGLRVRMIPADEIITAFSSVGMARLDRGTLTAPHVPVLDFRAGRKPYMRPVYEATLRTLIEDGAAA